MIKRKDKLKKLLKNEEEELLEELKAKGLRISKVIY